MATVPKPFIVKTRSTGSRSSPVRRPRRGFERELEKRGPQRVEPLAGSRRDADDRPSLEERPRHELGRLLLGDRLGRLVGQVALGERHQPARDPEQAADLEVLARLRHHRLVGRDDQHHGVDAVGAGQHVAHEALVARNVDERGDQRRPELGVREAEVDRDAALLLLRKAVGIGAGERAHERALAVVDVARGPDDEGAQRPRQSSRDVVTPNTDSAVLCSLAASARRASFSARAMNE